jgi:hypothetical protein
MNRAAILLAVLALACACSRKERRAPAPPVDSSITMTPPTSNDESIRCPAALVATRKGGTDSDRFVAPAESERAAMREAIERLVKQGLAARAATEGLLAPVGYEIVDVAEIPNAVLLRENEAKKRGGGAYLVRAGARAPSTFVQTPHTFFDEGTLPLGCELFQRSGAGALFIDTAHRYKSAAPDEKGEHPADVAHNAGTLFQAATEGLLRAAPTATIIQLHGFGARDAGTLVVVSNGEKKVGDPLVVRAAAALAKGLGAGVRKFPDETSELGATTNVQGTAVRASGGRFLHVEMEAGLRRELLSDAARRSSVLGALAAALEER